MDINVNSNEKQGYVPSSLAGVDTLEQDDIETKIMPVVENDETQLNSNLNKEKTVDEDKLKKAVDKLNKFFEGEKTHVEYEMHDTFKSQFIVKIIDDDTKQVITEIPPKKILDMVAEMCKLAGVIVDKKA